MFNLHLMNIKLSNVTSLSIHLSGQNTLPSTLNSLSTWADVGRHADTEMRYLPKGGNCFVDNSRIEVDHYSYGAWL